jgi:hypothetical protein
MGESPGHESASYPDWLFRKTIGETKEGVEIVENVRPDSVHIP